MTRILTKAQFSKSSYDVIIEELIDEGVSIEKALVISQQLVQVVANLQVASMMSEVESLAGVANAMTSAFNNERDKEKMRVRNIQPKQDE